MRYPMEHKFKKALESGEWTNWIWQEQNAIMSIKKLLKYFPNLSENTIQNLRKAEKFVKFKITPYVLSLIEVDANLNPILDDPIWNIFVPHWDLTQDPAFFKENWELPEDMITPILQHKYTDRVAFRIRNTCLAYCQYCFEAKRTLAKQMLKDGYSAEYFHKSLDYIKNNKQIEEVVISGGEPLTMNNDQLESVLQDIRKIPHIKAIRIQTSAFVHNPFRIDDGFIKLLVEYDVTGIGLHIDHPRQVTPEFEDALKRFSKYGCRTLLLAQIPLLKNINDNIEVLRELLLKLYVLKVKPYYLLHAMPETLGAQRFRTSVLTGVKILRALKRHISNPALPEYVIVHCKGKHSVPFEIQGTDEFIYHNARVCFLNWKNEWCVYEEGEN